MGRKKDRSKQYAVKEMKKNLEKIGAKPENLQTTGTEQKTAESARKMENLETTGPEPGTVELTGTEQMKPGPIGTEQKDSESTGTEQKGSKATGSELKNPEINGTEQEKLDTASTEQKNLETAGTEWKFLKTSGTELANPENTKTVQENLETTGTTQNLGTTGTKLKSPVNSGMDQKDPEPIGTEQDYLRKPGTENAGSVQKNLETTGTERNLGTTVTELKNPESSGSEQDYPRFKEEAGSGIKREKGGKRGKADEEKEGERLNAKGTVDEGNKMEEKYEVKTKLIELDAGVIPEPGKDEGKKEDYKSSGKLVEINGEKKNLTAEEDEEKNRGAKDEMESFAEEENGRKSGLGKLLGKINNEESEKELERRKLLKQVQYTLNTRFNNQVNLQCSP